jgi:hypothetical protein
MACSSNAILRWSTFEKIFFSNSIDLKELLDAVVNADYEFYIYFVQKLDFGIENLVLSFSKIVFLDFLTRKFFQKKPGGHNIR